MNGSSSCSQDEDVNMVEATLASKLLNPIEEKVVKKLDTINILKSKLKLLNGKISASFPEYDIETKTIDTVLRDYDSAVEKKILEKQVVKYICQTDVVKSVLSGQTKTLSAEELEEQKSTVIQLLKDLKCSEMELQDTQVELRQLEDEYSKLRAEWDNEVSHLRQIKYSMPASSDSELSGHLYDKLCTVVEKLKLMRWLISKLVTTRTEYDWIADPHNRLNALKLTRNKYDLDCYIE